MIFKHRHTHTYVPGREIGGEGYPDAEVAEDDDEVRQYDQRPRRHQAESSGRVSEVLWAEGGGGGRSMRWGDKERGMRYEAGE